MDLGPRQRQLLMAALLMRPGQLVSRHSLTEIIWEKRLAHSNSALLHDLVSDLRAALKAADPAAAGLLTSADGGYRLDVLPGQVDLHRLRRQVEQARDLAEQDLAAAASAYRAALDEWPSAGPAEPEFLTGLSGDWVDGERRALADEYRTALLGRLEADLRLGGHDAALPPLARLASMDLGDERVARLYLLALYRSDGPGAALHHYTKVRAILRDDLGVDPGPELQRLHGQILRHDPDLDPPPAADAGTGPAADAGPAGSHQELAAPVIHAHQVRTVIGGSVHAGRDVNF